MDIITTAQQLLLLRGAEQNRLQRISRYVRGKHDPPYAPKGASTEYRWLMRKGKDNFLPLVVNVISQQLHVDGYRPTGSAMTTADDSEDEEPIWNAFRANRMLSRQHGVHRTVAKYGCAYVTVLPGTMGDADDDTTGISVPVVRPVSPLRMTAFYADAVDDEWPAIAIEEFQVRDSQAPGKMRHVVTVYDDTNRYILVTQGSTTRSLDYAAAGDPLLAGRQAIMEHGLGVCPVIRFQYESDLDGDTDCTGEVEPLIPIQDQINFTTFNLMLAEQFAAYRQRYVSGMVPVDEDGRAADTLNPGVDRLWIAEDAGTKWGEFDVTPLQPYIDTREASIRHAAVIAQVPAYALLGSLINLSAESMSAARDGLDRRVEELQATLTDSWRNTFRLEAKAMGDSDGWDDLTGAVIWRDTSARAFAATIDGLGKAAQMLGVPAEELWRRIPGATADDVRAWVQAAEQKNALAELDKLFNASVTGGQMQGNPTPAQPYQAGSIGAAPIAPPLPPGAPPAGGTAPVPPAGGGAR